MKPLLVSILLFVPFALGARYYFVCQTLQWCNDTLDVNREVRDLQVSLPDGRSAKLSFGNYAEGALVPPRSAGMLATLDSLTAYLHRYPDYVLTIRAPWQSYEQGSPGSYRDLGMARAAELSGMLQRRGIPADRMELYSRRGTAERPARLVLGFQSTQPATVHTELPTGETLLDSTALLGLRFEANSTALAPTEELTAYAIELIDVLNNEPELELRLIGHTDDRANEVFNDSLGLWRARAVAAYFKQLGYQGEIKTLTAGEREPIASNATEEGRFLNRRVEVRVD
jgi:outer membrane protein OmpA-like peptidoglycan-associated protein